MDAERVATLDYLDRVTLRGGGRRGRGATVTRTGGLVYAHTRHATSRAGDLCPHDHVLLANAVELPHARGAWKAADTRSSGASTCTPPHCSGAPWPRGPAQCATGRSEPATGPGA